MPSWAEVQDYVRKQYKLHEDNDDSFKLIWEFRNNRFQMITVTRFTAMDREWVEFTSAACRRDEMPAEVALTKNFQFAVGALALDGDVYVVRYSAQLATMDLDELELPLHVVAQTADSIEAEFTRKDDF
ncbi:MAG: hypothetical protein U0230_02460 [Polyangiales bacterium]